VAPSAECKLSVDNGDRRTDRQTDRQTDRHRRRLKPHSYCWAWLDNRSVDRLMFSHFDTIPACDRRTDGRTGRPTHFLYQ